jgi:hypothetical protein
MVTRSFIAIGIMVFAGSVAAESMRCGSSIVNETTSVADLLAKCGEPLSKEVKAEDVYARNSNGSNRKIGTTLTERWIYKRTAQSLPMAVTIVDGKVTRLERAD